MNVLLQNFIKQSFDDRGGTTSGPQTKGNMAAAANGSGTKKSSKVMNISQDNINYNTFDASQNVNKVVNQKNLNAQNDDNQVKKS